MFAVHPWTCRCAVEDGSFGQIARCKRSRPLEALGHQAKDFPKMWQIQMSPPNTNSDAVVEESLELPSRVV